MPVPGNVRSLPGNYQPPAKHGLEVFATFTAKAVSVVLIVLFAFTLGMTARQWMDLPRFGLMQQAVQEVVQICRDIAQGARIESKGDGG